MPTSVRNNVDFSKLDVILLTLIEGNCCTTFGWTLTSSTYGVLLSVYFPSNIPF